VQRFKLEQNRFILTNALAYYKRVKMIIEHATAERLDGLKYFQ